MDAIEPILPNPSILPEVQAAERSAPIHRDGGHRGDSQGHHRRRSREQDAVEVDVDGIDETGEEDGDPAGGGRRDLAAQDRSDPPVWRIDLSA